MLYCNINCPVCENTFAPDDDIVVCPDCGTPHHRDCWQQHGGCINTSRHAEGFVFPIPVVSEQKEDNNANDAPAKCGRCGAQLPKKTLVCPECGAVLSASGNAQQFNENFFMNGVNVDPNEDIGGITAVQASQYVQVRSKKYIPKFSAVNSGRKLQWNWAAFLISPFWFFYRKLYKAGLAFLAVTMIVILLVSVPMAKVQDEMYDTLTSYVSITNETTVNDLMNELGALTAEQQSVVTAAMMKYYYRIPLLFLPFVLVNIAAALLSVGIYRSAVISGVRKIDELEIDRQQKQMLMLRRGGVSFMSLLLSYLALNLLIDVLLSV